MSFYNKFFLIFLICFSFIFAVSTHYSGVLNISPTPPGSNRPSVYSTDFSLSTNLDVYISKNTKVFLPKNIDQSTKLEDSIYMCPGDLVLSLYSTGQFHKNFFSLNASYYLPISYTFACDCSPSFEVCIRNDCEWESSESSPPYGITFISSSLSRELNEHYSNIGAFIGERTPNLFNKLKSSFSSTFGYKKEVASRFYPTTDIVFYPNHRTYATLFLNGTQSIVVKSNDGQNIFDYPYVENGKNNDQFDFTSQKFSKTLSFSNNKKDSFVKGVIYNGQIYTLSALSSSPDNKKLIATYFPPPIDRTFSGITIFSPPYAQISFNEDSSKKFTVYVVEPNDCSQIDILSVSPSPLQNLELNKPHTITLIVSTPYELFGLKAKSIKMKSPDKWKITPIAGFDTPFSFSNPHELKVNLTPTTIIAKKSKVCFEIDFETDTEFCDGNICRTTKEVCVDYQPKFYCNLVTNLSSSSPLLIAAGESVNIISYCFLDNSPVNCPSLTWTASGFNKPPSKEERISLTVIGSSKPIPFSPPGNPKVIQTTPLPPILKRPQAVTLHTYSAAEAAFYGKNPTPKSNGKIVASGITDDNEKFSCYLSVLVRPSYLPDLVPVVINKTMKLEQQNQFPTFSFKWGVRNEKIKIPKLKQDSPLSDAIPIDDEFESVNTDITIPFNIALYLYDVNTKSYVQVKNVKVNGLKAGDSYIVEEFSYVCPAPIFKDAIVAVDIDNVIKETNEDNNKKVEGFNCIYRLVCPDFV
ncbi:MAG: CARDB domain-containing protein [Candidatus Anstonellaceae archaeon]